jgi:hypothetical protein
MLIDAGFDAFAETTCKPYYAAKMGCAVASPRPVLPHAHGRYFEDAIFAYYQRSMCNPVHTIE